MAGLPGATSTQAAKAALLGLLAAPVIHRRYKVVTKGRVIASHPPRAIVYLAESFLRATTPIQQVLKRT